MEDLSETTELATRAAPAQLKTPKGTLDFMGTEMKLRKHILYALTHRCQGQMTSR